MDEHAAGKRKQDRELDFSAYPRRHVVLRIAYHGQGHDGLARQENSTNTIEHCLLAALLQVRLIPPLRLNDGTEVHALGSTGKHLLASPDKFSRCGRTDKGVSALGNAVSLLLRGAKEGQQELQYSHMLNRVLPPSIRVVAWAFVPDTFDARFSCLHRTYRYYFSTANRDLGAMQAAAALLRGTHDFRNFCKMDVVNVSNFVREIFVAQIFDAATETALANGADGSGGCGPVAYLEIRGNAFLYHQIRCIMAILFLVSEGKEEPTVVTTMLDLARCPGKPCYPLASEFNLVLWDCSFAADVVRWRVDENAFAAVLEEFANRAAEMHVAAAISAGMRRTVLAAFGDGAVEAKPIPGRNSSRYVPLLKRPVEHSFEQKVAGLSAAKRHRREANMGHTGSGREDAGAQQPPAVGESDD
jgi:tRNA pseudouridine38/39 synthase